MHDFSKPPHVTSPEETAKKRRLPVYILIIVGLFLLALAVQWLRPVHRSCQTNA